MDNGLYFEGDKVWLRTHQKKKGENPKLAPKYQGPYEIVDVLPYHTYRVMKNGKTSVQHESRIRLHVANDGPAEETVDQPWAKCGLFAAVAMRLTFCGLIAAFCLKTFAIMVCNILVICYKAPCVIWQIP